MLMLAAATTAMVIVGALVTSRTPRAIAEAEPLVQRAARFERGIARIVSVALALAAVVLNLVRNWSEGGLALMAGLFTGMGIAVLAGAITMVIRIAWRYPHAAMWRALGYDVAGFALMGLGALLRYGSISLQ